jgi:hypothetical protein
MKVKNKTEAFTKESLVKRLGEEPNPGKGYKLAFIGNFMKAEGYSYDVNNIQRFLDMEIGKNEEAERLGKAGSSVEDMMRFLANFATVDKIPKWLMPYIVSHAYYLIENQKGAWENKDYLFADLKDRICKEGDIVVSVP